MKGPLMPGMDSTQLNLPLFNQNQVIGHRPRPPRTRTCLISKLVYSKTASPPDGAFTLDCTIRNISEGGAKVILAKRQPLPSDLYLIVVKYSVAYWTKVVWLNYPARGLKFSTTYMMNGTLPDNLKFLRALWGDLYARPGHVEW